MIFLSVVVPVKNEAQSLLILYKELKQILFKIKKTYEIIFIDDGSTDKTKEILKRLQKSDKYVKTIFFRANFGKSAALNAGFEKANGEIIVTLDADLQDDPADIPEFIKKLNEGYDLVNGWRYKRSDNFTKKLSSYLFNTGTNLISGVKLHDFNCGMKMFKKEVANEIFIHGELHRFIPVLAAKQRFKVTEIKVNNRHRKFGESKYGHGLGRSWKGIIDLLTSVFISDFSTKPAHFFGGIGLILFLSGFIMDTYVTCIKITTGSTQGKIPLLLAGILFLLLGVQLLSTGLIAEMITYYLTKKTKSK